MPKAMRNSITFICCLPRFVSLTLACRWLPTSSTPLFHVEHDDGDQEDLEEAETNASAQAYLKVASSKQRAHELLVEKLIARAKREAQANLPKKPKTEYSCFVDAKRITVAQAHPDASTADVNKLLAQAWHQLDDDEWQVCQPS